MRTAWFNLTAIALAVLAAFPGAPAGRAPSKDSVVATFSDPATPITNLDLSARSGRSGKKPRGKFKADHVETRIRGKVTCLRVIGRQATLGLRLRAPAEQVAAVVGLDDAGATAPYGDRLSFNYVPRVLGPTECPTPDDPILHVNVAFAHLFGTLPGTIRIHDGARRKRCINGGHRRSGFKIHKKCLASVRT